MPWETWPDRERSIMCPLAAVGVAAARGQRGTLDSHVLVIIKIVGPKLRGLGPGPEVRIRNVGPKLTARRSSTDSGSADSTL